MSEKRGTLKHYFRETKRPIYALLAAAPFFVAYEVGIVAFGGLQAQEKYRNGVEYLMRALLAPSLGRYGAILVFITLGVLVLYYQKREESMTREAVVKGYVPALYVESILYAAVLFVLSGQLREWLVPNALASGGRGPSLTYDLVVTSCGAGAYEELLFRLLLLALVASALFRLFAIPKGTSAMIAIVATSLLFSGAHYIGGYEVFMWGRFLFRFAAGMYFAAICTYRSFGAAVATHAFFDMMVFAHLHHLHLR